MYYDVTYLLVILGAVLCMIASSNVNRTYEKYSKVRNARGLTGAQVAQMILDKNNVRGVSVQHVSGNLTDHFNPSTNTVNLSDAVYNATSVAALGVAAHECGHVMQHETGYVPITIRSKLVPFANIGSQMGLPMVILGLIIGGAGSTGNNLGYWIMTIGIWAFMFAVAFQLVTLPVEFDASKRALVMLEEYGILGTDENEKAKKVLKAAAMTYVAAAASSLLQLLRLILISQRGRRDD